MPETEQATTGTKSIEEQYRELQAEFTRRSQQLAEYERRKEAGELVEKTVYDEHVKQWANDHPDEAQDWLGWNNNNQQPSAIGGQAGLETNDPMMGFDDSIFDPQSEAHQKFVREHGEKGLRQAQLSKLAPDLLAMTGLGRQFADLLERDKQREEELAALREQAEQAQRYSIAAYDKSQLIEDPRRKEVRETIERLKSDPNNWFDIVQKVKRADELEAEMAKLKSATAPTTQAQPPPAQPPEQLAARIDQASVVPQGAAGTQGGGQSQYTDPFDYAVDKALGKVA